MAGIIMKSSAGSVDYRATLPTLKVGQVLKFPFSMVPDSAALRLAVSRYNKRNNTAISVNKGDGEFLVSRKRVR